MCARRRQVSDLCGITIGSCSAQARFVSGLPSQKSGAFGQETALFGRSGLASCLRWCDPHPLSRPFTMALKNRVLDSACHIGEQHCGERRDIDVATGPLAKQQARRRQFRSISSSHPRWRKRWECYAERKSHNLWLRQAAQADPERSVQKTRKGISFQATKQQRTPWTTVIRRAAGTRCVTGAGQRSRRRRCGWRRLLRGERRSFRGLSRRTLSHIPGRGAEPGYRFLPPNPGMAVACFIHDAAWRSSRSSSDSRSTPRESLPIPIGVTGGTGLSEVPRPNVSLT